MAVVVGVGLTSLALLATVLVARSWSGDNGVAHGPDATWGVPSSRTVSPSPAFEAPSGGTPSAASAAHPVEVARGRLRNLALDLCLDGGNGTPGTAAVLAECSSAASQQWSYQDDGLLRSVADPTLCLAAHVRKGTVGTADCVVHSGQVQYDLTVRGELLLRWRKGKVVAPGAGREVVVADRDGAAEQRWRLEAAPDEAGAEPRKNGDERSEGEDRAERDAEGRAERGSPGGDQHPGDPEEHGEQRPPDGEAPREQGPEDPPEQYETRMAQAGCCDSAEPSAAEPDARELVAGVREAVTSRAVSVASALG
ncbi:ricin-type beta-trefoil lectin domain protein [Streptomyces sp. PSKA30]|nr:ricin-type beta-trefoil lectin domain protein [Streptomyces sp. PSKA30]